MARLRSRLRPTATPGVEQKKPQVTPGVVNFAFSDATARSHCATSWQPAAAAALERETDKLARTIADKPPVQTATGKRAFYQQLDLGAAKAYELASGVISASFAHEEGRAGMDAFLEKKKPPRY